ncbi:MAG: glycoside hydrolase 100 family protein [Candidatus Latescibacterota bacterium]
MKEIVETAREKALELLSRHITPRGLMAVASQEESLYEVTLVARDTLIASLGASLGLGDAYELPFQNTLMTLGNYQNELGQIPNSVTPRTTGDFVEYESQDCNLWYVLGHCYLYRIYKDKAFLLKHLESIQKAIHWLRCQDSDANGLLEFPEGGNWMDFFSQRHIVLLDNAMWYGCLTRFGHILDELDLEGSAYLEMAQDVKRKINLMMWMDNGLGPDRSGEARKMGLRVQWVYKKMCAEIGGRPYYLPFVDFMDCGDYFDSFGNLAAILFDVAAGEETAGIDKSDLILNYIRDVGCNRPFPVLSVYPPIQPGDKGWRDYFRMGYVLREKANVPYQYHNGGIWPFIGGFYVAALVKCNRMAEAEVELEYLARENEKGYNEVAWGFPEYLHGQTGHVMGGDYFSWSAGMYLYAYECVKQGRVIGL